MSEGHPRLVAVPEVPERSLAPGRRPPRRSSWLLVAAVLACAAGWGLAQHRSGQLQRELSTTQSELSGARAKLAILEAQRSEVHSQLKALSVEATALAGRLAELEALAASDRAGATNAQALRSGSATGE
ncbi:MAG: hypothetical protein E4H11_05555 [Myxococcales bacterium]|nr:MAG: hypothetical protein E4H11_05555 [Myxococcales bacterium]